MQQARTPYHAISNQNAPEDLDAARTRPSEALEKALRPGGAARPAAPRPAEPEPARHPAKREDWAPLFDVIRRAGGEFKAGQIQVAEQNTRIQELGRRVRDELTAAEARAQAAEARAQAAEARAQQAETLAAAMLDWRERLYEAIVTEFSLPQEERDRKAA